MVKKGVPEPSAHALPLYEDDSPVDFRFGGFSRHVLWC